MKKLLSLLLVLALVLCGCGTRPSADSTVASFTAPETSAPAVSPTEAPAATVPGTELAQGESRAYALSSTVDPRSQAYHDAFDRGSEPLFSYDAVMQGNKKFLELSGAEAMSVSTLLGHWSDGTAVSVRQLTVVDLDGGTPELILWLQSENNPKLGFEVLYYDGGDVYGYALTPQPFDQLKTDGTFAWEDGVAAMTFDGPNWYLHTIGDTREAHSEKADVIWFPDWMSFLYPGTPEPSTVIRGVNDPNTTLIDTQTQQQLHLSQIGLLLVPADIPTYIVAQAELDMDGDGLLEQVLQIGTQADPYLGFVVLKPQGDLIYCQSYYYRSFMDLKADGTFSFSSSSSDYGYGKLSFQNGQWTGTVLAEQHVTTDITGSVNTIYFVGGQMTTAEVFKQFEQTQNNKPAATWQAPEG